MLENIAYWKVPLFPFTKRLLRFFARITVQFHVVHESGRNQNFVFGDLTICFSQVPQRSKQTVEKNSLLLHGVLAGKEPPETARLIKVLRIALIEQVTDNRAENGTGDPKRQKSKNKAEYGAPRWHASLPL